MRDRLSNFWLEIGRVRRRLIVFGAVGACAICLVLLTKSSVLSETALLVAGAVLTILAAGIGVPLILLPEEREADQKNRVH